MGTGGGGELTVVEAGVVAVALQAFGQQDVAAAVFDKVPEGSEGGRAAAEDKGAAVDGALGAQGEAAVAQSVAEGQAGAVHGNGRKLRPPQLP